MSKIGRVCLALAVLSISLVISLTASFLIFSEGNSEAAIPAEVIKEVVGLSVDVSDSPRGGQILTIQRNLPGQGWSCGCSGFERVKTYAVSCKCILISGKGK